MDLEYLQIVKPVFICDRGYLSEDNEKFLVKKEYPFILVGKTVKKIAKDAIDNNSEETMVKPYNWIPDQRTYGIREREVDYSVTVKNEKRKVDSVSLCLYFNNTSKGILQDGFADVGVNPPKSPELTRKLREVSELWGPVKDILDKAARGQVLSSSELSQVASLTEPLLATMNEAVGMYENE